MQEHRELPSTPRAQKQTRRLVRSDYLNSKELRQRGWTESATTKFLGEPDRYVGHPFARHRNVRHWLRNRVEAAEGSCEFQQWLKKSMPRKEAAKVRVETRLRNMVRALKAKS